MAKQWDLTKEQRQLAELLALGDPETGDSLTIVDACKRNGTSRSTYYEWLHRNEDFTEYMNYIADKAMMTRIAKYDRRLDDIIMSDKTNENAVIKAISEAYKRSGKFKDNMQVDVNVGEKTVSEKSDEELAEYVRKKREQRESESDESSE